MTLILFLYNIDCFINLKNRLDFEFDYCSNRFIIYDIKYSIILVIFELYTAIIYNSIIFIYLFIYLFRFNVYMRLFSYDRRSFLAVLAVIRSPEINTPAEKISK